MNQQSHYLEQQLLKMGSSLDNQSNDSHVRIYVKLNKEVYYAGQVVQGTVYINCQQQRPYKLLNITIQGKQQCLWTQRHRRHTSNHINSRGTYHVLINLAKFELGIQKNHYEFPFSILLPRAFPASLELNFNNYIKYEIAAQLPAYDKFSSAQIFKRSLHIRQAPRGIPHCLKGDNLCIPQCGCCYRCNCGSVYLFLQTQINYIECDKAFNVGGIINNQNGQLDIKNYKIVLREKDKVIYKQKRSHVEYHDLLLYDANTPVPKGTQESFEFNVKIPPQFTGYTAIGNIIYRAYFLALVAEVSCCIANPTLEVHTVVLNSALPSQQADQIRQVPLDWNPVISTPSHSMNIEPYLYTPSFLIDVRNEDGQVAKPMGLYMLLDTQQTQNPN